MINIQTIIPLLFAMIMAAVPMTLTANNSLSWNPAPSSISSAANDITLNYSINQSGIVKVQLFDENWNQIGEESQNVSAGSGQITLALTPGSTPTSTNFLQAKLFNNDWSPLIPTLQTTVTYNNGPSSNSLAWNPAPSSISSATNDITLNYSINQSGTVKVQLFDENWNQIGEESQNVSAGSGQITLALTPGSTPTSTNFLQAKLFNDNWSPLIPTLQTTVTYNGGPSGNNSLVWNPAPSSISSGANDISLNYSINQSGIVVIQLFDVNWNQIGQASKNVSSGTGQATFSLTPDSEPTSTNFLQAKLFKSNWEPLIPTLQLTVSASESGDCGTSNGVCKVYPDQQNELLGADNHYEANMYVSRDWTGPLKAFWGAPKGIFWAEWDNNAAEEGHQSHEEFDYKALRSSWTWDAIENGYPTKINQITDPNLTCTANGQWRAGSSGRCHINMTAWIYNHDGDGSRCDVIIHTWDNSGNFKAKYTGGRFINIGTISDNGVTYDVLRTLPGGLGEKASYNLIPQNSRQNTPFAAFPTNTQYFEVNVKKILDRLIQVENSREQTITSNWYLDGMEWTITGQSGDNVDGVFVPDSQGKWTFNGYNIPNIPFNANKVETGTQSINFDIAPNPFTHSFNIEYHLTQTEPVSIQLFTQEGKRIKVIKNKENNDAGTHIETINTDDLPSGMYLLHLTTSDSHGVQKLVKF